MCKYLLAFTLILFIQVTEHFCNFVLHICSIYVSKCLYEQNPLFSFHAVHILFISFFPPAKSSAFCFFVHSSHGSSCSIKEKIVLLNASSSGTYGVWRPVNGGRLEALPSKTFRDEFSISLESFTP